ncbi:hypothetical protein ACFL2K_05365, partial [Candidatus Margulisiibacteriota bacterium]
MNWIINKHDNVFIDYHRRLIHKGYDVASSSKELFLVKDDITARSNILMFDHFETKQTFLFNQEVQDPSDASVTVNEHPIDLYKISYEPEVTFGPDYAVTTVLGKLSREINDFIDEDAKEDSLLQKVGIKSTLYPFRNNIFKKMILKPYYFLTYDKTTKPDSSTYELITNKGWETEFQPISILTLRYNYDNKETKKPTEITDIENTNTSVFFKPYKWLDTAYIFRHSETESPLVGQTGKIETTNTYQIKKYLPYDSIVFLGQPWLTTAAKPLKGSGFTSKLSDTHRSENNSKRLYARYYQRYDYRNFEPITGIRAKRLSFEHSNSDSLNTAETNTTSSNTSINELTKKAGDFRIKPKIKYLDMFTYTLFMEDKAEEYRSTDNAYSATSNIRHRLSPEFTRKQKLEFNPGSLSFYNVKLGRFSGSLAENHDNLINETTNIASNNVTSNKTTTYILDNKYLDRYAL